MNKPRLKYLFLASFCITMWLISPTQSSFVSSYFGVTINSAFAADPGCTNEDCPPDPGCTNEDCPPDPGCTNEDCPPDYYAGCCCYEDYDPSTADIIERLCCCKDGKKVSCRLSIVTGDNQHDTIADLFFEMGQIPSKKKGQCAPAWFVDYYTDLSWNFGKGCGWWKQLHICGPLESE